MVETPEPLLRIDKSTSDPPSSTTLPEGMALPISEPNVPVAVNPRSAANDEVDDADRFALGEEVESVIVIPPTLLSAADR